MGYGTPCPKCGDAATTSGKDHWHTCSICGHRWQQQIDFSKVILQNRAVRARISIQDAQRSLAGVIMALSQRPKDRGHYDKAHALLVLADRELRMARKEEGNEGLAMLEDTEGR